MTDMMNAEDSEALAWQGLDWRQRQLVVKRVGRGEAILDKRLGNVWPFHISLDRLDLNSACHCVLGQLAVDIVPKRQWLCDRYRRFTPGYVHAIKTLGFSSAKAKSHGFLADPSKGISADALAYCWRRRIRTRNGGR